MIDASHQEGLMEGPLLLSLMLLLVVLSSFQTPLHGGGIDLCQLDVPSVVEAVSKLSLVAWVLLLDLLLTVLVVVQQSCSHEISLHFPSSSPQTWLIVVSHPPRSDVLARNVVESCLCSAEHVGSEALESLGWYPSFDGWK